MARILTYPKGKIKTCPHCKAVFEYYQHELWADVKVQAEEVYTLMRVVCPLCGRDNYLVED